MVSVTDTHSADRHPATLIEMIIASVESFDGAARINDCLMVMIRDRRLISRFGQAVFLREEIDAGTIHGLSPVGADGLVLAMKSLSAKAAGRLAADLGFWLSAVPAQVEAAEGAVLIAVDPSAVEGLQTTAASRGLALTRVGVFGGRPNRIDTRRRPAANDAVQAAFRARRRFWREPVLV